MSLFSVKGTINSYGSFNISNGNHLYSFVEIIQDDKKRVHIMNVATTPKGTGIEIGAHGEFFFDKVLVATGGKVVKHLYAARGSDGRSMYDPTNYRACIAAYNIFIGIPMLLALGFGLVFIAIGTAQFLKAILMTGQRSLRFYGNPLYARRLKKQEAVRI